VLAHRRHPRRATWWIGVLFAIGSICFVLGPLPGFIQLVGSAADGTVFFVGSVFFTSAALLQFVQAAAAGRAAHRTDWWSSLIQLVGTVYFNVNTFRAMQDSFDNADVDRLVWRPELFGSICFLVSGLLAYRELRGGTHNTEWRIAAVNLAGCVLFMISALAGYVVPSTGDVLDLAAANVSTALGALCFLIGAVLLLPQPREPDARSIRSLPAQ
jgi:hypothetical protein